MSTEINKHLGEVELAVERLKVLLNPHHYPSDLRTLVVAGTIDQLIEHHASVLILVRSGKVGSAFALARSIIDGMYRGLWLNFCATDGELEKFEKEDKLPLRMDQIAAAIDEKYRAEGFFDDLRKRGWPGLCSYAHTGMLQLGRRFTGHQLKPSYRESEIHEVTTAITTAILTLSSKFLAVQNFPEAAKEVEQLISSYGPASKTEQKPLTTSIGR